jgi:hypothetical protein
VDGQQLRGLPEVVTRSKRREVGVAHRRHVLELLLDPADGGLGRASVHPGDEAQRKQVLAAGGVTRGYAGDALGRAYGHRRHRDTEELEVIQRVVLEGVVLVARLAQVVLGEAVLVHDDHATLLHGLELRDEGGGVHRHEDVGMVARREDVA